MTPLDPARPGGPSGQPREPPAELEARNLVDQLPAIVYDADVGVEGRWHYVSSGVQALLGFSPEEWLADPRLWARQMHPDDRERVFSTRGQRLSSPTSRRNTGCATATGGSSGCATKRRCDGRPGRRRWHGVISDVTDRKLAEAELERRAEQQAAVARLGKHALEGCDVSELMHDALSRRHASSASRWAPCWNAPQTVPPILRAGLGLVRSALPASRAAQDVRVREPARIRFGQPAGVRDAVAPRTTRPRRCPTAWPARSRAANRRWGTLWLASTAERPLRAVRTSTSCRRSQTSWPTPSSSARAKTTSATRRSMTR